MRLAARRSASCPVCTIPRRRDLSSCKSNRVPVVGVQLQVRVLKADNNRPTAIHRVHVYDGIRERVLPVYLTDGIGCAGADPTHIGDVAAALKLKAAKIETIDLRTQTVTVPADINLVGGLPGRRSAAPA